MKKYIIFIPILLLVLAGCGNKSQDETREIAFELIDLNWFSQETPDMETSYEPEPIVGETKVTADFKGIHVTEGQYSSQPYDYIVYAPENADSSTPIFIFLHGNSDPGKTPSEILTKYKYLRYLNDSLWRPNVIIIVPISSYKSHWSQDVDNVKVMLSETINNYGGSMDNVYISGASAGADGLTTIAKNMECQGACYMAGHLNGSSGKMSVDEFLTLWQGKTVYYYRDNLAGGGYGYNKEFVEKVKEKASDYDVTFKMIDLEWNHDYALIDAVLLPEGYWDKKGQYCHDAISKLIYGE